VVLPIVRRAYLVAAPVWVATLPLATYAATRVHASTLADAFAFGIYAIGMVVCHQKPERSFHLWGAQLPVCARCTGIYLGAALGVVFRSAEASRSAIRMRRARVLTSRFALVLAALPTAATLLYEWTTGVTPANAIRFAAGLPLGAVVSWLVLQVN